MSLEKTGSNNYYLFIVCFIAALGGFLFGFDTAVISGVLSFVVKDFSFNPVMEGWFVSCALLGCIIGVAVSGKLSDKYGRKKVMLLSAGLFLLSAVGCMLAVNATLLISFRLIGGLGIGVASMICPLYISEFSPPSFRGRMVALYQLAITIGIVAAYFSNAYLLKLSQQQTFSGWLHYIITQDVWRSMIGLGLVPALAFFALLVFCSGIAKMAVTERQGKGSASLSAKGKHFCCCSAGSTGCKEKYAGRKRQSERIAFTGLPHCTDYWSCPSFSLPGIRY